MINKKEINKYTCYIHYLISIRFRRGRWFSSNPTIKTRKTLELLIFIKDFGNS